MREYTHQDQIKHLNEICKDLCLWVESPMRLGWDGLGDWFYVVHRTSFDEVYEERKIVLYINGYFSN